MDLNKHIVANDTGKPFHSSGFAEAANGNHFGATTSMSFEQRRQIDQNRQAVAGYQRSAIGGLYGVQRARPAPKIVVVRRPTSRIIPLRKHNPYP